MILTGDKSPEADFLPIDIIDAEGIGVQISADGRRLWVCVNGVCVLRVKKTFMPLDITDDRKEKT